MTKPNAKTILIAAAAEARRYKAEAYDGADRFADSMDAKRWPDAKQYYLSNAYESALMTLLAAVDAAVEEM